MTAFRAEYERNNERVKSKQGRYLKKKRTSTVEPVFGTLTQFLGLRKVNTRGLSQANKVMHMAAIAYNLKKYLKFITKTAKSGVMVTALVKSIEKVTMGFQRWIIRQKILHTEIY